jgi:hypothetical protein
MKIFKILSIVVKSVQWIIVNGVPFVRSAVEYFKQLKAENELKKAVK